MLTTHLTGGACRSERLVRDDVDRFSLLEHLRAELGPLLAYCVMDTHVHFVAEGAAEKLQPLADAALHAYARAFNRRHGRRGPLLRGRAAPLEKRDAVELARTIYYTHKNPLDTTPPLVKRPVDHEWSSARAFVGLARDRFADPARARRLMGDEVRRITIASPALADTRPVPAPRATPDTILAAAAAVLRVLPAECASARRSPALREARAVYVTLGRLESYTDRQLAPALGRSRQRTSELAEDPDFDAVRMARTLFIDPLLRATLRPVQAVQVGRSEALSLTSGP
ncbi:MAG TPA: hypothetical protein VFF73_34545 [Planctomycetota bacterium]|nr:hypothetical protein [Planctomycetota bacterium]